MNETIKGSKITYEMEKNKKSKFDYVIVGSGAGGGPLAANLALAGFTVMLLEAGGKEASVSYSVPSYAPLAADNEYYRWDFFVRHYKDQKQQEKDPKFVSSKDGILYPRSSTLGGCTAHNAMITTYPSNSDWEYIQQITGDDSWNPINMRRYFEKIENCRYLDSITAKETGHGTGGWLGVEKANISKAPKDWQLIKTLETCKEKGFNAEKIGPINENLDPNAIDVAKDDSSGYFTVPQSTYDMTRNGSREFVLNVQKQFPERLIIETHALASKILFDEKDDTKAIGIEYLQGAYLYAATPRYNEHCQLTEPETKRVYVNEEVILACGVFNTPQLLMLSGIGDKEQLEEFDIAIRINLPGVGNNLQDRYEISLINEMQSSFKVNEIAKYSDDPEDDPFLSQWLKHREGPYNSIGSPLMYMKKSFPEKINPDIILFARTVRFEGFFPNWFWTFRPIHNQFSWTVLKAHTNNRNGVVKLKSSNPRDTPYINFNSFSDNGEDLNDLTEGFKFARVLMQDSPFKIKEVLPGVEVQSDHDIKEFIKNQAWGHHASCSCPIGADDDKMAVLDSRFRVRGAKKLRVVDASVFPKIPGTFIVTPIYMVSEKASEVIIEDQKNRNK
ncbi:choline dehydrogenase [Flavobacterium araucananum]|nr:GMC oxidoreductase [Flavobacterium araucananum]PWJ91303.1 choline dehydrogenase [Flavobacterium araucananum]